MPGPRLSAGRSLALLGAIALVGLAALAPGAGASTELKSGKGKGDSIRRYPWDERVRDAARYARGRTGAVSFAVVDELGHGHSFHRGQRYSSASVVKAMLLVAYLRRGGVRGRRLHGHERRPARADDPRLRQRGGDGDPQHRRKRRARAGSPAAPG